MAIRMLLHDALQLHAGALYERVQHVFACKIFCCCAPIFLQRCEFTQEAVALSVARFVVSLAVTTEERCNLLLQIRLRFRG